MQGSVGGLLLIPFFHQISLLAVENVVIPGPCFSVFSERITVCVPPKFLLKVTKTGLRRDGSSFGAGVAAQDPGQSGCPAGQS